MENSVESLEVSEISNKSRSLYLQNLYVEKSSVSVDNKDGAEGRVSKRKRWSLQDNEEFRLGQGKRRRSRKEVSLSSFEPTNKKIRKSLNAVAASGLNSGVRNLNKSGLKLSRLGLFQKNPTKEKNSEVLDDENLRNSSNSLKNISRSLDDNVIPIPKRPRGFLRRKKFQSNHISKHVGTSSSKRVTGLSTSNSKVGSDAKVFKLNEDPVSPVLSIGGKWKKDSDDFKENSSSRANSAQHSKVEEGASIRCNGHSTLKRVHRKRGKRRESIPQKQNNSEAAELLVDKSAKICEDSQEDDEENLEKNAAWMLSSRFNPSCTGFSKNDTASALQSTNGLSLLPLFSQNLAISGSNFSVGSLSTSADAAGRVLRPRKQHKERNLFRRRRHFYEIVSKDLDAYWVLNRRIKVFWPLDQNWYFGLINNYDPERKLHHVKYDDRDEEWINLRNERFKLLLLPSEVPGKAGSVKSELGKKNVDAEDDQCMGSNMDSETIISWLARSTRLVKSSPHIIKKQKISCLPKHFETNILSQDPNSSRDGRLALSPSRMETNKLSSDSVVLDRSPDGEMTKKSTMESTACSKDGKLPFVYFRRRFHKKRQGLDCESKQISGCRSIAGSVTFLASVVDRVGALEEYDVTFQSCGAKGFRHLNEDCVLWHGENLGLLRLAVPLMKLEQLKLKLCFPLRWVHNLAFGAENIWLYHTLLLFQYGTVVSVWPKVHLEMVFVDNAVGLRFLLFEGCLTQAVALLCLILATFHQPREYGKFVDLELPVTSIRFKLSDLQNLGRQIVFVFYNFMEVKSSKWLFLDSKLKQHCSVMKQLALDECTHENIKALQSGIDQLPVPSTCKKLVSLEKSSRKGIMHTEISKELISMDISPSSSNFNEKHGRLPPFVLSFVAAPTFFHSLHLKLLMENNAASISFQNRDLMSLPNGMENCDRLIDDDCSMVGDFSNEVSEFTLGNIGCSLSQVPACSVSWSCAKPKLESDALSISNKVDWEKSSQKCLNSGLNVSGASVGLRDSGKNETDGTVQLERHLCHQSGSEQHVDRSSSSVPDGHSSPDKSESGCFSCLNGSDRQNIPLNQVENQSFDGETRPARQYVSDLAWNMNDCTIRNPTAPRSIWHRSRPSTGSLSFSNHSKMWPNERPDLVHKKPRTRISYLLPFGGYEFGSKPSSHHRKRHPYKRIKTDNEKRLSGGSRSPQRHPELLSCDVNILVTAGDRGWRELGAQVVLEFVDHKDWRLVVKLMGTMKYSYKAHQFLQPGTTNRYTHVMMWKGGKDWTLEFPDRTQWTLFKEMYEECYNRNVRAASVKNIPIPGVRLIESDNNAVEVPFVRSSLKYFRQIETEVDMAMDPSCVLYDMDSADEKWISKLGNASDNGSKRLEISEEMFERMMDMFEKVAYAQQCDSFTGDEIEELMVGVGPMDIIKAVYEHWRQKRQTKGMPLIRQFQPPLWEKYQQEVKEWELAMNKAHSLPNGCKEKATLIEKPSMFAFCLKPRGLEMPNKGPKQRSQRKFPVGCHNSALSRDQDGFQVFGRKLYGFGEERAVYTDQDHESSDASPWLQTTTRVLSPRDAVSTGYQSMSSDGSDRSRHPKLYRNKSKKMAVFPSDSQAVAVSYNQRTAVKRNGVCRWNPSLAESSSQNHYQSEGSQRYRVEQSGGSDFDEFRLRGASSAAQHASNMAKLKREKAQRLLYRADVAIHKAVIALITAEAKKASSEEDVAEDG